MFSLRAIRDLNKVVISHSGGDIILYTEKGWDFDFRVKMDTALEGSLNLISSPLGRSLLGHTLGISTVLDISRKYAFAGTEPIRASLPCYLVLEEDPNKDIFEPLNNLLRLILPTRGRSASSLLSKLPGSDSDKSLVESIKSADFWSALNAVKNAILNYTGDVYALEVPDSFKAGNSHNISLIWGGHTFEDVFISGVRISSDKFLYAYGSGSDQVPIPDYVRVDISFETTRIAALPSGSSNYFSGV